MAYDQSEVPSGSTVTFEITATKDGLTWDITGATVSLVLTAPDGAIQTKTATVSNGPGGVAGYTCTVSDIVQPGIWRRSWRIVSGGIEVKSPTATFRVF